MESQLDRSWDALEKAIKDLRSENERLRQAASDVWAKDSQISQLKSDLREANRKLEESQTKAEQYHHDAAYWREATWYGQKLKKPCKRPRHIPNFNGIKRAVKWTKLPMWIGNGANPERIFLKRWRKENRRKPGLNNGRGVLELILSEDSNSYAVPITQRDATVAATVVQWLGTNCGRCFIEECEREIRESREKKREAIVA